MRTHHARWSLLLLACLMLVACEDRREPVKPRIAQASSSTFTAPIAT